MEGFVLKNAELAAWLTTGMSALVMFFVYRLIRKNESYGELEKHFEIHKQTVGMEIRQLEREMGKLHVDSQSMAEIHQYFGQIKMTQQAFFKRMDELRADFRAYKQHSSKEIDDLRKGVYELKGRANA